MNITKQQTPENRIIYTILILAFYLFGQFGGKLLYPYYGHLLTDFSPAVRSVIWTTTYFGLVPLIGAILILGRSGFSQLMGMNGGFSRGLAVAFLVTLPMLVGYAWVSGFTINIEWGRDFLFGTLAAPFFEEFFYRAFLFGLLYRVAGWGLWPATLLDGLLFGAIHISQGDTVGAAAAVFAVTGLGAVGFSVIYKEWDWNLWLVIFLHAFMNFYWMAFDIASNAAGGFWANVFRVATVAIIIGWTVYNSRKRRTSTAPRTASIAKPAVSLAAE
jgi:hypothetical protein